MSEKCYPFWERADATLSATLALTKRYADLLANTNVSSEQRRICCVMPATPAAHRCWSYKITAAMPHLSNNLLVTTVSGRLYDQKMANNRAQKLDKALYFYAT